MTIAWYQVSYKMTFHHGFIYLFTLSLHFVPGLQFAFCTDRKWNQHALKFVWVRFPNHLNSIEQIQPNSSDRSYQRFDMQMRRKGQFCIVLTLKPRLCATLNKGIFDRGLNSNNSYWTQSIKLSHCDSCAEIKILTRKWPTSLGFLIFGIFFHLPFFSFSFLFAAVIDLLLGLLAVKKLLRKRHLDGQILAWSSQV